MLMASRAAVGRMAAVLAGVLMSACGAMETPAPGIAPPEVVKDVGGGDPVRGRDIVASGAHGCTACHAVPGIQRPRGVAGPPLDGLASRAFIAGQLPNTPETLIAFLQDPPALVAATGMPDVRVSLEEARHIAAYLYTLGGG